MSKFIESATARETSPELMAAILRVAGKNEAKADDIWENGPDDGQLTAIVEIVTGNGRTETTDYCWGAMGASWESQLSA